MTGPAFDLVVVGCGGGPNEDNLSSYLLKAGDSSWEDGIVALEAGSGIGGLSRLLESRPDTFTTPTPTSGHAIDEDEPPAAASPGLTTAADVYTRIRCYLITHAHLDHVNGLVLSAGSVTGPPKLVYGAKKALEGVATIFSGDIWPRLASWEDAEEPGSCLLLSPLEPAAPEYTPIAPHLAVRLFPVSHGPGAQPHTSHPSAAYFVRHTPSGRELLFFGDVEPDALAAVPQNAEVWRTAAPALAAGRLRALFIECSWPAGRPAATLYGHLAPEHLVVELGVLALEVAGSRARARMQEERELERERERDGARANGARKKKRRNAESVDVRGALEGLRVYIIHCKDDILKKYDEPIRQVIARQVRELVDARGLGAEIIAVEQGMHISI